jgi:hypothetical protein
MIKEEIMFKKNNKWGVVGGSKTSAKKKRSSPINGRLGGRPKKGSPYKVLYFNTIKKKDVVKYYNDWRKAKSEAMYRQGKAYERIGNMYQCFYDYAINKYVPDNALPTALDIV